MNFGVYSYASKKFSLEFSSLPTSLNIPFIVTLQSPPK